MPRPVSPTLEKVRKEAKLKQIVDQAQELDEELHTILHYLLHQYGDDTTYQGAYETALHIQTIMHQDKLTDKIDTIARRGH